ncbi:dipeptidyl peptidase III [Backusella circina FSU 941]|nr:dipeptidyl peptidase III [Backusella circina FSU 941]
MRIWAYRKKIYKYSSVLKQSSKLRLVRRISTRYFADENPPFSRLEAKKFFDTLSDKEKKYAHYMSRASFQGTRIIITQTNPKAIGIYDLVLELFTDEKGDMIQSDRLLQKSQVDKDTFHHFIQYCAQFLGNLSNYKSFGDEKFIPRISREDFAKIVSGSDSAKAVALFEKNADEIYKVDNASYNLIGFPDDGHQSGYYSKNVTKEDIKGIQAFLQKQKLDPLNTRLFKDEQGNYQLKIAASNGKATETYTLENKKTIEIHYTDFQRSMGKVAESILAASSFTANPTQKRMLDAYHTSFSTGSVDAHKESQKEWLKDLNPQVETNIGFIETYRDPQGVRAEWEGFVAMVNKEQSLKFNRLVENAPLVVSRLPWPPAFERETLNKPDFTSLEVLSFATAGVPAGINIPNYSDITQIYGSKNVSLGNVISAQAPNEKFPFLRAHDLALYKRYRNVSFEVQVGTHELGHGTGKLLAEDEHGHLNFDPSLTNPLTNLPVSSWYKPGETFNTVFKNIAASYEECRAECIALSLAPHADILKIFNFEGEEAEDILYVMYLNMARAGLTALEFYKPDSQKWGQAHMQARYGIMRVMMEAGQDFLTFKPSTDNGQASLEIHLDKSKIRSVGAPAISKFLTQLQIYKATGDEQNGSQLYLDATHVPQDWHSIRDIVIRSKQPRKSFVQANTFIQNDKVVLKEYEASAFGMIQSYIERRV